VLIDFLSIIYAIFFSEQSQPMTGLAFGCSLRWLTSAFSSFLMMIKRSSIFSHNRYVKPILRKVRKGMHVELAGSTTIPNPDESGLRLPPNEAIKGGSLKQRTDAKRQVQVWGWSFSIFG